MRHGDSVTVVANRIVYRDLDMDVDDSVVEMIGVGDEVTIDISRLPRQLRAVVTRKYGNHLHVEVSA